MQTEDRMFCFVMPRSDLEQLARRISEVSEISTPSRSEALRRLRLGQRPAQITQVQVLIIMANSVLSAAHFQNEDAAFEYVESHLRPRGPVCPHCGEKARLGRLNGKTTRPGLRKCWRPVSPSRSALARFSRTATLRCICGCK